MQGHETQKLKWHRDYGVGAMARLFTTTVKARNQDGLLVDVPLVDLPYGDPPTVEKVERLLRQARNFASSAAQVRSNARHGKRADDLMAAWFPMKVLRSWRVADTMETQYMGYEPSFPGFRTVTWEKVPWR